MIHRTFARLARTQLSRNCAISAPGARNFCATTGRFDNLRNKLEISSKNDDELEVLVKPIPRPNESIEVKRARLLYQSRKRGILETDLLLSRFAKKYLKTMTMEELEEYDKLLDLPDWDIYYWATKNFDQTPIKPEWENSKILKLLQENSVNSKGEILRMPELKEY